MSRPGADSESLRGALPTLEIEMLELQKRFSEYLGDLGSRLYSPEGLKEALTEGLRRLGRALWRAARILHADDPRILEGSASLYFWPGYESIVLAHEGVPSRVAIPAHRSSLEALKARGYPTEGLDRGMLFRSAEPADVEMTEGLTRAALYYHAALSAEDERGPLRNSGFSIGGTHSWLTDGSAIGVHTPKSRLEVLEALRIQVVGHEAEISGPYFSEGEYRLELDLRLSAAWGREIGMRLNDTMIFRDLLASPRNRAKAQERVWPSLLKSPHETDSVFLRRMEQAAVEARADPIGRQQVVREWLYSYWLMGCFLDTPSQSEGFREILAPLLHELERYEPQRAARISRLTTLDAQRELGDFLLDIWFTSWISLSIPKTVHIPIRGPSRIAASVEQDLGSAMFLADFPLNVSFLRAARMWVHSYYLSLRQVESVCLASQLAGRRAEVETARALHSQHAHAIGTEMTMVEFLVKKISASIAPLASSVEYENLVPALESEAVTESDFRSLLGGDPLPLFEKVEVALDWRSTEVRLLTRLLAGADNPDDVTLRLKVAGLLIRTLVSDLTGTLTNTSEALSELARIVSGITEVNSALMRVHDPATRLTFSMTPEPLGSLLMEEVHQAFNSSLVAFFERAFPAPVGPIRLAGTEEYARAAKNLFPSDNLGVEFADSLRACSLFHGNRLVIDTSALGGLPFGLKFQCEAQSIYLVPESTPTSDGLRVFRVWARELFLNAIKAMARSAPAQAPKLTVEIQVVENSEREELIVRVTNTATGHDARRVAERTIDSAGPRDGHEGMRFLKQVEQFVDGAKFCPEPLDGGRRVVVTLEAPIRRSQATGR